MRRLFSLLIVPLVALPLVIGAAAPAEPPAHLQPASARYLALGYTRAPLPSESGSILPRRVDSHVGSYARNTITVKVSGSRGGIQTGPFTNLTFDEAARGKTLTIHLEQVTSIAGDTLPRRPIHLYRSLVGPRQPGDDVVAFSESPIRQAEEVAVDRTGGTLVWRIEPGDYLVFFPQTQPVVMVPRDDQPASAAYTVMVE